MEVYSFHRFASGCGNRYLPGDNVPDLGPVSLAHEADTIPCVIRTVEL